MPDDLVTDSLTRLQARIETLEHDNETLVLRNGYLEAQRMQDMQRILDLEHAVALHERRQTESADLHALAAQLVNEPTRRCATCQHQARNHTLGRCRKKHCGCGGWRG